jgi:hypothetical protein
VHAVAEHTVHAGHHDSEDEEEHRKKEEEDRLAREKE